MEDQAILSQLEKNTTAIEAHRKALTTVISLLERISNAVDEGFTRVNERLALLEGKEGMQGVNHQLSEIKNELHKIQKTYPYDEMFENILFIGKA